VILCGPSVGQHPVLVPRVLDLMGTSVVGVSTDVRSHSPLTSVESVADLLRATDADSVLAIGGGSAFVTARAACILHGEGRSLESLATQYTADGEVVSPRLLKPKLPIVALPTTPTTATGKAGTAVTVAGRDERLAMHDPKTRARSVLLDPDYLSSSPPSLVKNASLNALVMAVEGLCSARTHIFADATLIHAVRQFAAMLPAFSDDQLTPGHRMDATLTSLLVGEGTDATGGGLTAALSHTIGHQYGAHNGTVDAVLLPHVLQHVPPGPSAARAISDGLGCAPSHMIDRLKELFVAAGALGRLRDLGVQRDDLEKLADDATKDFAYGRGALRPAAGTVTSILSSAW
jgi:alcohol dehydrogenase class IV